MSSTASKFCACSALCLALAGCGGGGPDIIPNDAIGTTRAPLGTYTELTNTSATTVTPLSYTASNNAGALRTGTAGSLDHDANTVSGGDFAGTIDGARTLITVTSGGSVTLTPLDGADHARTFVAQGLSEPLSGIIGQLTESGDMPFTSDPTVTYSGASRATIVDGAGTYTLTGDVTVTADFGASLVDIELSDLDGSLTTSGGTTVVNNVAVIRLDNAALSGNAFTGGTPSASGAISLTTNSPAIASQSAGNFYGPGADEVGGVLFIDDSAAGDTQILGLYLAE